MLAIRQTVNVGSGSVSDTRACPRWRQLSPKAGEAGLAGLYFSQWYGLWAPKGTPNNVIGKLNNAVVDALADPLVRSGLADLAQGIFPSDQQTPAALRAYHKAEIVIAPRWKFVPLM
jgi:tripartite-type tricarboxylate transporter receptor subunit TctC